jgi:hypothetical protein
MEPPSRDCVPRASFFRSGQWAAGREQDLELFFAADCPPPTADIKQYLLDYSVDVLYKECS